MTAPRYGVFVLEHQGAGLSRGASAYFDGFKEIGARLSPEVRYCHRVITREFSHVHMDQTKRENFSRSPRQFACAMHYGTSSCRSKH